MPKIPSEKEIKTIIAAKRGSMVEFLRLAVTHSNPCMPENEGGDGPNAQDLVVAKLRQLGLEPEVRPLAGGDSGRGPSVAPAAAGTGLDYTDRRNVIAVWKGRGSGRSLTLNSHADIVGPADRAAWKHPPFSAHFEEGVILGRGSCDAKGSLTTYLYAIECLRELGFEPSGDIVFESVPDEEGGGLGAVDGAQHFPTDGVLIGEPTDLDVMPGTRGACGLYIRVRGREAHSGVAFLGVNAILNAQKYISAITDLQRRLDLEHRHPLWDTYPVAHVFNIATIKGGKFGGVVPEQCDIGVTCGCIGGETTADLRAWVQAALDDVTQQDSWLRDHPPEITWTRPSFEPSACPPDHPLVQLLARAVEEASGRAPSVRAMTAGTDLRAFAERGIAGANFGPGRLDQGHAANERIAVADMERALAALLRFIPRWTNTG